MGMIRRLQSVMWTCSVAPAMSNSKCASICMQNSSQRRSSFEGIAAMK